MLACSHCDASTELPEDGARHIGWRIFRGNNQLGDPLTDVSCPTCSGRTVVPFRVPHLPGEVTLFNVGDEL